MNAYTTHNKINPAKNSCNAGDISSDNVKTNAQKQARYAFAVNDLYSNMSQYVAFWMDAINGHYINFKQM